MTSPAADTCASFDACIDRMRNLVRDRNMAGLNPEDNALIERLLQFDDVGPRMIPFLKDPDVGIAEFATAVLRDVDHIDARYLPQIVAGLDRNLGWLPPAVCAIPGKAAARAAVMHFLVSKDAPTNQAAVAIERCGSRAVPFIVEAAKCERGCPPRAHSNLAYVLRNMDSGTAAMIGPQLVNIVREKEVSKETATGTLQMICALGSAAASVQNDLLTLRVSRPELADSIDAALVGIQADSAAKILARRLGQARGSFQTTLVLRDIAELGARGREAGKDV